MKRTQHDHSRAHTREYAHKCTHTHTTQITHTQDDSAWDVLDELFAGPAVMRLDASNGGHVTDLAWLEHERWRSLEALVLDGNWLKV